MKYQKGVSLTGLIFWLIIGGFVALLALKVFPSVMEYFSISKAAKATAAEASATATVPEIRKAFGKRQEIDYFKSVNPEDLEITKDNGKVVISFSYQTKIPLVYNVSLVIDYKGSTSSSMKD